MSGSCWEVLGLDPTTDERAIKRAYAVKLKGCHPEDDAAGFAELNAAYQEALGHASGRAPRATSVSDWTPPPGGQGPAEERSSPPPPRLRPEPTTAPPPVDRGREDAERVLTALLRLGDSAAIAELDRALLQDEYTAIALRTGFEDALIEALATVQPAPLRLLAAACERFEWHDGRHEAFRRFPHLMHTALGARATLQARQLLEQIAARGIGAGPERHLTTLAARVLMGDAKARWEAKGDELKAVVQKVFQHVRTAHPLAGPAAFDADALKAWIPREPTPQEAEALSDSRFQGVLGLVMVVVGMIMAIALRDWIWPGSDRHTGWFLLGGLLVGGGAWFGGLIVATRYVVPWYRAQQQRSHGGPRWFWQHATAILVLTSIGAGFGGWVAFVTYAAALSLVGLFLGTTGSLGAIAFLNLAVSVAAIVTLSDRYDIGLWRPMNVALLLLCATRLAVDAIAIRAKMSAPAVAKLMLIAMLAVTMIALVAANDIARSLRPQGVAGSARSAAAAAAAQPGKGTVRTAKPASLATHRLPAELQSLGWRLDRVGETPKAITYYLQAYPRAKLDEIPWLRERATAAVTDHVCSDPNSLKLIGEGIALRYVLQLQGGAMVANLRFEAGSCEPQATMGKSTENEPSPQAGGQ